MEKWMSDVPTVKKSLVMFWFVIVVLAGLVVKLSVSLVDQRHRSDRLSRELTATVEQCGESWRKTPIK